MYNRLCTTVTDHLHNSKLLLNELDKGQEVLPVQAILVQLRRRFVGGEQDEGAVLTQAREQLQHQSNLEPCCDRIVLFNRSRSRSSQPYKPHSESDAVN